MKRRRANREEKLHCAMADFLTHALPADSYWSSSAAGGGGAIRGAKLRRMGYRKGHPDIEIIWQGKAHYIELKTAAGVVSGEQEQVHAELLAAGAWVAVCRSPEDVEDTLRGWSMPLRATMRGQGEATS